MRRTIVGVLAGAWLLALPRLFAMGGAGVSNAWLCGLLAVALALVGHGDASRGASRGLALIGLWLVVAAFVFHHGGLPGRAAIALTGLAFVALFARAPQPRGLTGGGWRALWRPQGAPVRPDPFSLSPDEL